MSTTPATIHIEHEWVVCHDHRHSNVPGECPACQGYLFACIDPRCELLADHVRAKLRAITGDTKTTSVEAAATADDAEEALGEEVETPSAPSPSRPDAHDRPSNLDDVVWLLEQILDELRQDAPSAPTEVTPATPDEPEESAPLEHEQVAGSAGPGNEGSFTCRCGYYLSWPEDTTDEDLATMRRLRDEHLASGRYVDHACQWRDVAEASKEARDVMRAKLDRLDPEIARLTSEHADLEATCRRAEAAAETWKALYRDLRADIELEQRVRTKNRDYHRRLDRPSAAQAALHALLGVQSILRRTDEALAASGVDAR